MRREPAATQGRLGGCEPAATQGRLGCGANPQQHRGGFLGADGEGRFFGVAKKNPRAKTRGEGGLKGRAVKGESG